MDVFCQVSELLRRYERYVHDLRRLFIFHGLTCGTADDFSSLARKLQDSTALRIDLPAMLSNIRNIEHNRVSANEMLTLLALASGGIDFVEGRSASIGASRAVELFDMLLAGIGSWGEGSHHKEASLSQEFAPADTEAGPVAAPLRHAIDELRTQLGEISRRIEDLEPTTIFSPRTLLDEQDALPILGTQEEPSGQRTSGTNMSLTGPLEDWSSQTASERGPQRFKLGYPEDGWTHSDEAEASWHESSTTTPLQVTTERLPFIPTPQQMQAFEYAASSETMSSWTDDSAASEADSVWHESVVPSAEWTPSEAADIPQRQNQSGGDSIGQAASLDGDDGRDSVGGAAKQQASLREAKLRRTRIRAIRTAAALAVSLGLSDLLWSALHKEGRTAEARVLTEATPYPDQAHAAAHQAPEAVSNSAKAPVLAEPHASVQVPLTRSPQSAVGIASAKHQKGLPTQDASGVRTHLPVEVPTSVLDKNLISSRKPTYPLPALQQHLSGRVILNAFISREGSVRRMDVVDGSPLFIQSAISAVSWRRYKPYLLRGRPVEVMTRITVNYPRL